MTPKRLLQLRWKLQESRQRLRVSLPRFADPLDDMEYLAVRPMERMSTDGSRIWFDPNWLQKAEPFSLDFMLAHQLMHIYLGHIHRSPLYKGLRYHLACDIVANSHLRQLGWQVEQLAGVGTIYHQTFYPVTEGAELTPEEAFVQVPMDPDALSPAARRRYAIDSDVCWAHGSIPEDGVLVLSPGDPEDLPPTVSAPGAVPREKGTLRLPVLPSVPGCSFEDEDAEDGEQGGLSEEEAQKQREEALFSAIDQIVTEKSWSAARKPPERQEVAPARTEPDWDAVAKARLQSVRAERATSQKRAERARGETRVWQKINRTCLDWRLLLNSFLQEEVCDYSFLPPDRRLQDSDFFLPDFSDAMLRPLKVLFMVDTSSSVDDGLLSIAYTEIGSAIEQFNGNLVGLLGFFDTFAYPPKPFASILDIRRMRPMGGGGTDFGCIFRTCRSYFGDEQLASLIVLTDGQAEFPPESAAAGIPTFWLLTDDSVVPPWGRRAYLSKEQGKGT